MNEAETIGDSVETAFYEGNGEMMLKAIIKGLIARDIYGDPGAYSVVINHRNPDVKAAYDVLNDRERYQRLLHEGNPEYERLVKHN